MKYSVKLYTSQKVGGELSTAAVTLWVGGFTNCVLQAGMIIEEKFEEI